MGGELREGFCVIGGVVKIEVRDFFDSLVKNGEFDSRSKAIGYVLTRFCEKYRKERRYKNDA